MKPKLEKLIPDIRKGRNVDGNDFELEVYLDGEAENKINELIDYVTKLEDRVRVLESNNFRGHR